MQKCKNASITNTNVKEDTKNSKIYSKIEALLIKCGKFAENEPTHFLKNAGKILKMPDYIIPLLDISLFLLV